MDWDADPIDIGANVGWYPASSGDSDTMIFIDQAKGARPFFLGGGDAGAQAAITFDDNGYAENLGAGVFATSVLLNRSTAVSGIAPYTGEFRLYGTGDGDIRIDVAGQGAVLGRTATGGLPTEVIGGVSYWYVDFAYTPPGPEDNGVRLKVWGSGGAGHIQDLSVVHHSHLEAHRAGETFTPEILADLANYDTLRFMEWMSATKYEEDATGAAIHPEGRWITPDAFTYNTRAGDAATGNVFTSSAPISELVALANAVGANPWISLPVDITDARARQIATYVDEMLAPGLTVFWEYGNELWNSAEGFEGYRYAERMGGDLFGLTGDSAVVEWAAYRGPQLYGLIDQNMSGRAEARFIAPVWAFDAPTVNDWINTESYTRQYFEAAAAQALADAPPAPAEIVTDYAIGMYFGGLPQDVRDHIAASYTTDTARAEAHMRWLLFGTDPARYHELQPGAFGAAAPTVDYTPGMSISVSQILRADIEAGLDPLNDLGSVLRLEGTALQYRGVSASGWQTILSFTAPPDKTLAEMIADVELIGEGFLVYATWRSGVLANLVNATWLRLEGHQEFVEDLGLNWVAYEGGLGVGNQDTNGATWLDEFIDDGWGAEALAVWLDRMAAAGVDGYNHYKSHSRFADSDQENWGALRYAGQPLEDAPVARLLNDRILASQPDPIPGNLLSAEQAAFDPDAWTPTKTNWSFGDDGTATETGGRNGSFYNSTMIPVTSGERYTLSFQVDGSQEILGKLRVIVQAFGSGSTKLIEWESAVTAGEVIEIDLEAIPEPRDKLRITFRRIGAPDSELELSDLSLTPLFGPVLAPVAAPALAPVPA